MVLNPVGIGGVVADVKETDGTADQVGLLQRHQRSVQGLDGRRRGREEGQGLLLPVVQVEKGNILLGQKGLDSVLKGRQFGRKASVLTRVKGDARGVGVVPDKTERGGENRNVFEGGVGESGLVVGTKRPEFDEGRIQKGVREEGEHTVSLWVLLRSRNQGLPERPSTQGLNPRSRV